MTLDNIFQKSNLDENKKKSKMYFGRLLINLRKHDNIKLYSLLESVYDTNLQDNVLIITLADKSAYDLIDNTEDVEAINKELKLIDNINVKLDCNGKEKFDLFKFEQFLKEEFGSRLTIIK